MCNISEIERYTVALYREKFKRPAHIGTGILLMFNDKYYLISAYHVFDMEDELLRIENDPDEDDVEQDDLEIIMAKTNEGYLCVNYKMTGVVFTAKYNHNTKQPIFHEDTEWCCCELSEETVNYFTEAGKIFYDADSIKGLGCDASCMIISGYPKYAQKDDEEHYRSFKVENVIKESPSANSLFRIGFINNKAYNYEKSKTISLPPYGISGMSGGGIWAIKDDKIVPIGIILKQDLNENYVEGFRMNCILESISQNKN